MTRDHGRPRARVAALAAIGAHSRSMRLVAVLGEEDVLEVRLAADDVDEPVCRRGRDDRPDRAVDAHRDDVARWR